MMSKADALATEGWICGQCGHQEARSQEVCPSCDAPDDPLQGKVLAGTYRLGKKLAEGGMGSVYSAEHIRLRSRNKRAIKVIQDKWVTNSTMRQRFQREIEITHHLSQDIDHIVKIHDSYGFEDGIGYYVMEFLKGQTLEERIKHHSGWLDMRWIRTIFLQICETMQAVHEEDLLHRDLKPDNIFLIEKRGKDFVKIVDFGIAKALESSVNLTKTQGILGTPSYMAPEQIERGPDEELDHRCDIYALGCILYKMLVKDPPFSLRGSTSPMALHRVLVAHLTEPPPSLRAQRPAIPERLEQLVFRMLEKERDKRLPSMDAVAQALRSIELPELADEPPPAPERPTPLRISTSIAEAKTGDMPPLLLGESRDHTPGLIERPPQTLIPTEQSAPQLPIDDKPTEQQSVPPFVPDTHAATPQEASWKKWSLAAAVLILVGVLGGVFLAPIIMGTGKALQLEVKTQPPGVSLLLTRGKKSWKGTSPFPFRKLSAGDYQLHLKKAGFQSKAVKLSLSADSSKTITLKPRSIGLQIKTEPAGAQLLLLQGKKSWKGTSPFGFQGLSSGSYSLQLKKAGFQSKTVKLSLSTDSSKTIALKKKGPSLATLEIKTRPPRARLLLTREGKSWKGTSPFTFEKLPAGNYQLEVSKARYKKESLKFSLSADDSKTIRLEKKSRRWRRLSFVLPKHHALKLLSSPRNARLRSNSISLYKNKSATLQLIRPGAGVFDYVVCTFTITRKTASLTLKALVSTGGFRPARSDYCVR